jgi:hypothetical protein
MFVMSNMQFVVYSQLIAEKIPFWFGKNELAHP